MHRTVLVVDVEAFSGRSDPHQAAVRAALYRALEQAFAAAGIDWARCHHEDRGDGVLVLSEGEKAPFVERLPRALGNALREHNSRCGPHERIRLRVALHAGEVRRDGRGWSGTAINLAFRLLDSAPLRRALAQSAGLVALVVSGWFHEDVVRHSLAIDQAAWWRVPVRVKKTRTIGWLTLPDSRSRNPFRRRQVLVAATVIGLSTAGVAASGVGQTGVLGIGPDLAPEPEMLVQVVSGRTGKCMSRNGVYNHPGRSEVPGYGQPSDLYQWECAGSDDPGHNLVLAPHGDGWLIRSSVRADLCFAADGRPADRGHFQLCRLTDVRQLWRIQVVTGRHPRTVVFRNRETDLCLAADNFRAMHLDACAVVVDRRTEWTISAHKSFADKECAPDGARLRNHETGELMAGELRRTGGTAHGCVMSLQGSTWLVAPMGEVRGTGWHRVHSALNNSTCLEPDGTARLCTTSRLQQWAVEP